MHQRLIAESCQGLLTLVMTNGLFVKVVNCGQLEDGIGPCVRMLGQRVAIESQGRQHLEAAQIFDFAERSQTIVGKLERVLYACACL